MLRPTGAFFGRLIGFLAGFILLAGPVDAQQSVHELATVINGEARIKVRTASYTAMLWSPEITQEHLSFSQGELLEGYMRQGVVTEPLQFSDLYQIQVPRGRPWLGAAIGLAAGALIGYLSAQRTIHSSRIKYGECLSRRDSDCSVHRLSSEQEHVLKQITVGVTASLGIGLGFLAGKKKIRWKTIYAR